MRRQINLGRGHAEQQIDLMTDRETVVMHQRTGRPLPTGQDTLGQWRTLVRQVGLGADEPDGALPPSFSSTLGRLRPGQGSADDHQSVVHEFIFSQAVCEQASGPGRRDGSGVTSNTERRAADVRIRLLGQFGVRVGEEELPPLDSVRAESLLTYLLLHRDAPQSRQRLAFVLWPDSTEA